ncbi:MAG: beta-galactosidase [Pleurocapsa minor GSE-CHR-MK-17-07R]|nr:beta-galactosidase [Pleurocapsa minor GSE-CHR-MK 17-07R]
MQLRPGPAIIPCMRNRLSLPSRFQISWLVLVACVTALVIATFPPPPVVTLTGPHEVITQVPQMCVHTRLIDEVEEWKIQRTLEMVRQMGSPTIVEFFPWAYAEPTEGEYNWASFDRIVRHASDQGITVIARLGLVPAWAQPDDDTRVTINTLTADRFPDFARFAGAFAARYAGVIDRIIIWNEPNLAFEWGYRQVDPAAYADLLRAVYPAIHAANPGAEVIAAGLAPNLEPPESAAAMSDLLYLEQFYEAGAANYFDALSMHPYGLLTGPLDAPDETLLNFRRAELQRDIMVRNGDADKPVYVTEMGWNDSDRWTFGVSPAQRIAYTLGALEYATAEWPWAQALCIWVMRYPAPTFSYPDHFTLLDTEFRPHPLYLELRAFAAGESHTDALWLPAPVMEAGS